MSEEPLRIEFRELGFDPAKYIYTYKGQPFTGVMFEGPSATPKAVSEFVDGLRHGMSRVYFPDGKLHSEARYEYGEVVGTDRTWYENGQLEEEITYTEVSKYVSTRRWSESGELVYVDNA